MNELFRELYYMIDELWATEMVTPTYRKTHFLLEHELEKLEQTYGAETRNTLDHVLLDYENESLLIAFRMGMRFGLQLNAL